MLCDVILPLQFKMATKMEPPSIRLKGRFTTSKKMSKLQNLKLTRFTKGAETAYHIKGRRIVDVDYFGRQFDKGCSACGSAFQFRNITGEQHYGLSSRFTFRCPCSHSNALVTSKTLKKKTIYRKRGAYAVNVKAALGKYIAIVYFNYCE